jgi:putative tryptophan/tyrosine transport system substrate-binding protein
MLPVFERSFRKFGWIDGRNIRIEYRWTGGDPALAKNYAAELVALKSDVILANSTLSLRAARKETSTTPHRLYSLLLATRSDKVSS